MKESRTLRREQAQPYVVVDIAPNPNSTQVLELIIENIGSTMARDVRVTFTPKLESAHKDDVNFDEWPIFKDGLPSLPPKKAFRFFFDIGHKRYAAKLQNRYDVVVKYLDSYGMSIEIPYVIDLGVYYDGPSHLGIKTTHHIGQAVEDISKTLKSWNTRGRLGITAWDGDKQDEDDAAEYERYLQKQDEEQSEGGPASAWPNHSS